jgi:hypothetical protein
MMTSREDNRWLLTTADTTDSSFGNLRPPTYCIVADNVRKSQVSEKYSLELYTTTSH